MKYIDMNTLRFLLHQVHGLEDVIGKGRYEDYDKDAVNTFLDAVKDFSDKELYPVFREMDEKPAYYKDGTIMVHPMVENLMEQGGEMGLINACFDYEDGGLQMPISVFNLATLIMDAANNHAPGYLGLTLGAANLVATFGSQELKDSFMPKMLTGEWGGTMCLTEPQAGSSLSDIVTSATPTEEGHYEIKGQKIFISGGDNQYSDNIIHLLLARIDGAPAGTKGISLFVVPKKRLNEAGELEGNDVQTAGEFAKMGQRGYCTTHLVFGEEGDCHGYLVGKPHQGLRYMFQMMNEARISTGRGATGIASAAYYASLQYANERPQGRRIQNSGKKDPSTGQTLIINHPDVRRMLMLQKAIAEGCTSLVLEACMIQDKMELSEDAQQKSDYHFLLELLTPVVKTYPSEMGRVAVSNGLQVLGGYGFCSEFVLQQYYRDIRIFALYEGTTGIQSLDLLGRKVMLDNGRALKLLVNEMKSTIKSATTYDELKPYAKALGDKMALTQEVLGKLVPYAMKGQYDRFLADATIFMEFFGTIIIGWQWLKMAAQAKQTLVTNQLEYEISFYESKIHTMKFFYKYEMSKTTSLADILKDDVVLTLPIEEEILV